MTLPTADPADRPERADAQRNRAKVLAAAERLFAERGATDVSMEDVARAAGVGKGTLYRRYPNRAALAVAMLDEHERRLQERMISGPPPLGPGAPAAERLAAFYAAMVELLDRHLQLALAAETGAARFRTGAYAFWRLHLQVLLRDAGAADPGDALADVLLAPLAGELQQHLIDQGITAEQRVAALQSLARSVLSAPAE
ncbi:TetR/AcrR family transcriptional regulator [Microlunatus speluncae]|uniref:TetR/AcrR family transcriptional regulator n=1 Tax=Microlunatus speluncae TaxID=2594267 RepID=UPI0012665802|nr:TetR/AcrR family transcriptional regulator [Microlunatus speluncae]